MRIRIDNFINNQYTAPTSGQYIPIINPATGHSYGEVASSLDADVLLAIEAAESIRDAWASTTIEERYRYLMKISDGIRNRLEEFAEAESMDNGKPLWLARKVDIPRAIANFEFFATAIRHEEESFHDMGSEGINMTWRSPLGTVACISPWNLPLYLFSWKVAPALATGNCVIAKPSEVTPLTAHLLSEIILEAQLPPGVMNIIHGPGQPIGATLTSHPKIKAISFTGSTRTGRILASDTAPYFKKLSLEMGGKNPNIVFADCDFDKMMRYTINSSFINQGQICLCGSRIFVENSIYDKFLEEFIKKTKELIVAPPIDPNAKIGAVVSEEHLNKILHYIELAQEEGGQIVQGGHRIMMIPPHESGYYIEPTIITGLSPDCRVNQEEIFGPVVTVMPFDSEEEVISYANGTDYGLSATVWTQNIDRCQRVARQLDAGIVWINTWLQRDLRTPFGGMKQSGLGREGGRYALQFFTEPKNVCIGL